MYSPIPNVEDTTLLDTATTTKTTPIANVAGRQSLAQTTTTTTTWHVKILTLTLWVSGLLFAAFASGHYVRRAVLGEWELWDLSDRHLYRPGQFAANLFMTTHMVGGSWLMILGPFQLISSIRRRYLTYHRIMGRSYIVASLLTATCIMFFVVLYRTSRQDIYEDVGNLLLAIAMITCAVQSYRHVRFTKQLEQHKWWSYRLFALVLAALLYRLYVVAYFAVVLFTPWTGSRWVFESLFFLFFLPNLIVVEMYMRYGNKTRRILENPWLLGTGTLFVAFFTVLNVVYDWLPSVREVDVGQASNIEHAYEISSSS